MSVSRKAVFYLILAFLLVFTCSQVFAQAKGPGKIPFDRLGSMSSPFVGG